MHIICTNLTIFYTDKNLYSDNTHFLHSLTPNINNIRFVFLEYNYKTINTRQDIWMANLKKNTAHEFNYHGRFHLSSVLGNDIHCCYSCANDHLLVLLSISLRLSIFFLARKP